MKTKDFQEATAKRICSQFKAGQKRILLADEVGLGKTIIASAVVKMVSEWHKEAGDDYFKVVYICSNINIANQNARKLGIPNDDCVKIYERRLSMQHLITQENENKDHAYYQLIPMTPSTSFTMTGGQGTQQERALIFAIMTHCSEWRKHERELEQLLKFDPRLKGWEHYKIEYCNRITECNDSSGNIYLTEMESALERYLDKDPELRTELRSICQAQDIFAIQEKERRFVINKLRRIFAQISLDRLEADLVIMDEFQRFKDLIAPEDRDDESSMLSRHFLGNRDMKVLLLSATPYKPYSTLEELAENGDESYQEFLQVMEFLADGPEQQRKFREVWSDYSAGLAELTAGELTVLKIRKQKAEDELYQYICRTERRSDSIIDSSKASRENLKEEIESLSPGDILSYIELQQLMEGLGLGRFPVEYVKSAPYLLSFMNYKVKDSIVAQLQKTEDYEEIILWVP